MDRWVCVFPYGALFEYLIPTWQTGCVYILYVKSCLVCINTGRTTVCVLCFLVEHWPMAFAGPRLCVYCLSKYILILNTVYVHSCR